MCYGLHIFKNYSGKYVKKVGFRERKSRSGTITVIQATE